jgi:hypothetical protein
MFNFPVTSRPIAQKILKHRRPAMNKKKIIQRFDPYLRATDYELKASISRFVSYLESRESKLGGRTRGRRVTARDKFHLAIEVLLSNLIVANARSPKTLLNIPLSNNTLRGNPRYRPVVYGKHFRDLITLMVDLHLIKFVTKGHNVREWRRREITTIRSTGKLLKAFPAISTVTRNVFTRIDPQEVIILKDRDRQLLAYSDNDETRRWRDEMQTINTYLREASISLVSSANLLDENGFAIRPDVRTLQRIWNNGDWNQGGRLYGGFWQTMKREERLHAIRIDDGPIANVDFCQFNLRLAYALAKVRPPRGDLYAVSGDDVSRRDWKQLREGRKELTNAMFNSSKPLTRWPGKTDEERKALAARFPPGTNALSAISEIRAKHFAIANYFEDARGLSFMRIESDILVASLLSLMRRGIPVLPNHDAVFVPERHAVTAKATLEREAKRRIGTVIPAEIKIAGE